MERIIMLTVNDACGYRSRILEHGCRACIRQNPGACFKTP